MHPTCLLRRDALCGATYHDGDFYAAVQGKARLIRDRETMKQHWADSLDAWFEDGIETDGLVLIEVQPDRIAWWEGRDQGEVVL
ncbi:MAG: pyridoxamine 5'-phosphate oxidase family protein [Hyphomonadaceae bacterium]|nr:pyridoxamine 5'-phosphate oxidase family protein [Hyphomonadaceae bacterium]